MKYIMLLFLSFSLQAKHNIPITKLNLGFYPITADKIDFTKELQIPPGISPAFASRSCAVEFRTIFSESNIIKPEDTFIINDLRIEEEGSQLWIVHIYGSSREGLFMTTNSHFIKISCYFSKAKIKDYKQIMLKDFNNALGAIPIRIKTH